MFAGRVAPVSTEQPAQDYAKLFNDIPYRFNSPSSRNESSRQSAHGLTDPARLSRYKKLQKDWDAMYADFDSRMELLDNLEEEFEGHNAEDFLEWMDQNTLPNPSHIEEVTDAEFVSSLRDANWLKNNEALGRVNGRLWSPYISMGPDLHIGLYKDTHLALRLHGRALSPGESDITTCQDYGINSVNPHSLLALRYTPLDNKQPDDKDFLFTTLGNVYIKSGQVKDVNWVDTGFLLLLHVKKSGERDGLYVFDNSIDQHHVGESEANVTKTPPLIFPRAKSYFSLAEISPHDTELRQLGTLRLSETEIELLPVSESIPVIAETGMTGQWSLKDFPIALFASKEKVEL